ncbi:MAG: peptidase C45 [Streptosporangiales bacterium]|nr:peptidase C45 [Streptosporangiales bacterium]
MMRVQEHDSGTSAAPERGRELGRRWADRIGEAIGAYRGHYADLGISGTAALDVAERSCGSLAAWHPGLGAELESIAAGAGVPVAELGLLNSRTEILAAAPPAGDGECSTVIHPERGISFQTWDWHPALVPDAVLWRYAPAPGRWVKTFTEHGMLAKIGINSAGLAVHLNILRHRADSAAGGVPVHAIARRVLDEADTLADAIMIARSATVSASTAITVYDTRAAEAASLEITPAGVEPIPVRADGWLIRTNHLLDPRLQAGVVPNPLSTTKERYQHLDTVVGGSAVKVAPLPELAAALIAEAGADAPICQREDAGLPEKDHWRTLLTVRLDPAAELIEYWPGTPADVVEAGEARTF